MQWPPSDPKLAREVSSMLAEMELGARIDVEAARRAMPRYVDILGRLLFLRFGIIPDDMQKFYLGVHKFTDELPDGSFARVMLHHFFRNPEVDPNGSVIHLVYWCARWHSLGCPAVTIEGKLAASLMATETPADVIDDVTPPWDCFVVRLPMDLIEVARLNFTHVVVHRYIRTYPLEWTGFVPEGFDEARERLIDFLDKKTGLVWGLYAMTPDSNTPLWRADFPTVLLGKEQPLFLFDEIAHGETAADRIIMALARLVVGISQMAENPNALRRKSTKKQQHRRWRFSKMPQTMEYVLAPEVPVKFDCTEAVGAYLRGDRKGPPRIQYVVRGHWRNQAHGPGRMARKRIWIQPHWKGPEDAPRLFREHRLEGKEDGGDASSK